MKAEEMWRCSGLQGKYDTWRFGTDAEALTGLVLEGKKTATCSPLVLFELKGESLPQPGEYSILLDSKSEAHCITRTTKVYTVPFSKVTAEQAAREGEGDLSLDYWRKVHRDFFSQLLKRFGLAFDEDLEVVFEEFTKVYPHKTV